jgi:hypothetical protein
MSSQQTQLHGEISCSTVRFKVNTSYTLYVKGMQNHSGFSATLEKHMNSQCDPRTPLIYL